MPFIEHPAVLIWILIILTLWTIPWKAMALWKSARSGQIGWFMFFVLINTAGIMEILYLKRLSRLKPRNIDRRIRRIS
ncbi:MAG: DUF5652 family protein [Patescibacteria group bacterium]|nr:hypothetical protein [Patescibacteria group bacterium]